MLRILNIPELIRPHGCSSNPKVRDITVVVAVDPMVYRGAAYEVTEFDGEGLVEHAVSVFKGIVRKGGYEMRNYDGLARMGFGQFDAEEFHSFIVKVIRDGGVEKLLMELDRVKIVDILFYMSTAQRRYVRP